MRRNQDELVDLVNEIFKVKKRVWDINFRQEQLKKQYNNRKRRG